MDNKTLEGLKRRPEIISVFWIINTIFTTCRNANGEVMPVLPHVPSQKCTGGMSIKFGTKGLELKVVEFLVRAIRP
jgi:hypothetical protein